MFCSKKVENLISSVFNMRESILALEENVRKLNRKINLLNQEDKGKTVYSEVAKTCLESMDEIDIEEYARWRAEKTKRKAQDLYEAERAENARDLDYWTQVRPRLGTCSTCKWFIEGRRKAGENVSTECQFNPPSDNGFPFVEYSDCCSKWEADK